MSSVDRGEARDLRRLPFGEEALGDAALIEHLDRARVQPAGARAGELLAGAPLDDGDVDPRQRQLGRQHQPRRTAAGDHHRMFGHPPILRGPDCSTQPRNCRIIVVDTCPPQVMCDRHFTYDAVVLLVPCCCGRHGRAPAPRLRACRDAPRARAMVGRAARARPAHPEWAVSPTARVARSPQRGSAGR